MQNSYSDAYKAAGVDVTAGADESACCTNDDQRGTRRDRWIRRPV